MASSILDSAEAAYTVAGNELSASIKAYAAHKKNPWIPFEDFRHETLYGLNRSPGIS